MWCHFLVWTVLVLEISQKVYTAPSFSLEYVSMYVCMIGTTAVKLM